MKATYKISGYTFTLEANNEGEMTFADVEKGNFSGSLRMLEDLGYLENDSWTRQHKVPADVIEEMQRIEQSFCDSL